MKKLLNHWPLLLITIMAAILRLYKIDTVPPALNWDEVSHGYNAYSLLKTGLDEWGIRFPLIFRAFGDYKLPVYIYFTILPVWLFSLTTVSVRLISVVAGIMAIPGMYLLSKQFFKNRFHAFTSALVLAILPWHIFISRPALEANLALTFFIWGIYFLLRALSRSSSLIPSALFLGMTLHTYNSYRVITPIVILLIWAILRPHIKFTRNFCVSLTIFLFSLAIVVQQIFSGTGIARYEKLNILTDNTIYQIGQHRLESRLPSPLPRLLYNRPVYLVQTVAMNYFGYFSPWFLYQVQGAQFQFALPGKNMLTLPVYLLSIAGFIICLVRLRQPASRLLVSLLLISPLAAALTADPPQALRPTPLIVPIVLLATLSLRQLANLFSRRFHTRLLYLGLTVYLYLILGFATGRYMYTYFSDYPTRYASAWQYGYRQAITYLQDHSSNYDRVFFTKRYGEPHLFYAFYTKLNPAIIQSSDRTIRFHQSGWYWTDRIDSVYFVNDWQIPNRLPATELTLESKQTLSTHNSLLITSVTHLPSNAKPLDTIKLPDGTPVFVIAEFNQ